MAIKYTKPDSVDDGPGGKSRTAGPTPRNQRFSNAPPSRKTLSWIIMGIALIITLLMIASELPALDTQGKTTEYVWHDGTVVSNNMSSGKRVLRVEIPGKEDEPPHVYDILLDSREEWVSITAGATVRIQTQSDPTGNIERIISVEPGGESPQVPESAEPISEAN